MNSLLKLSCLFFICLHGSLFAAPPTAEDDKAIAGSWRLHVEGRTRIYEISEARNFKIMGGQLEEKRGRLMPQDDGSYTGDADGTILRFLYVKPNDQIIIEWYATKSDLRRKLPPQWKGTATRITP